jgi:rod shape determining protein RodA
MPVSGYGLVNIYSSSLSSVDDTYEKQLIYCINDSLILYTCIRRKILWKICYYNIWYLLITLVGLFFGKNNWTTLLVRHRKFYNTTLWICKTATLALAKYLSDSQINLKKLAVKYKPQYSVFTCITHFTTTWPSALIYSIFLSYCIVRDYLRGIFGPFYCHHFICTHPSFRTSIRDINSSTGNNTYSF